METVYELLANLPASATLRAPPASLPGREVRATSYKVGNYLRSRGVHRGSVVGVADDPDPKAVFAFLGSALLAAPVRFDPPHAFDGRAVVAPTVTLGAYDLGPGGQRVGYGERPENPADGHFEGGVWSENPAFPPVSFDGDVPALRDADGDGVSHAVLLARAESVATTLDADDIVAIRAPFTHEPTVIGVLGALRAGATVLLPGDVGDETDGADTAGMNDGDVGDVAIVTGDDANAPEDRVLSL